MKLSTQSRCRQRPQWQKPNLLAGFSVIWNLWVGQMTSLCRKSLWRPKFSTYAGNDKSYNTYTHAQRGFKADFAQLLKIWLIWQLLALLSFMRHFPTALIHSFFLTLNPEQFSCLLLFAHGESAPLSPVEPHLALIRSHYRDAHKKPRHTRRSWSHTLNSFPHPAHLFPSNTHTPGLIPPL